ncbi:MAG: 2-keto-4-pentenoate hydratase [Hyphomonas sp.]|uniref:2-keto-4-pentenoate hydratase n=1 Tax=Hyphomonas sp. TaxID=87 RepID=UPI0017EE611C|nr:hypothetical protein [Hyphomonas sp.]MBA3069933.1 2-keto-4-pentenoate hydratase [Hyphomonas sp.]MBU3922357.1 2-keto-4-pentenoate hydratase [Alphaproteobacteria bacterium]MBU4060491.1 2-keto-4-pentenoate hydratase [Alphaproteobacteria bacterium]MBU4163159.1 2-keto-4-pentenoate hydratase [Alphaproteobacteria bacterium]
MADSHLSTRTGDPAVDPRAAAFVEARLTGRALPAFPGIMPATLEEAYSIQSQAIRLWPDRVAGWKVGRINAPWDAQLGTDRLAGPIFDRQVTNATSAPTPILIFSGGFGAVEGEIVIEIGADAPAGKHNWTLAEAIEFAGNTRLGVEIASSPFPEINDHGPLVTIADFGNNNGLILGREVAGWRQASPGDWKLRTSIDGVEVGAADARSVPGGPFESLRAVLEICARRELPLRRGMHISTGAVTGVHMIQPGQSTTIKMDGLPAITCRAERAPNTQSQANPA